MQKVSPSMPTIELQPYENINIEGQIKQKNTDSKE